ncbi:hypothetical protein FQN54_008038 [Arachnomyces sp. PD_36]|nr:hypothetical protein FQN54_008038 [Arachnomyces sp. PD_36]
MQSDSREVSQNTTSNLSTPSTPNTSQHGQHHLDEPGSGLLLGTHPGGQSDHAFAAGDFSSDDVSSQGDEDPFRLRRLSSHGSGKDSSPVDRISEYEKARTPSPRKGGHIGFMIVPGRNKGDPGRSIEEFPNEVLTHILSHLPPPTLSSISLVSRRFHSLVTTPHAWRIAFSRYFPGPDSLKEGNDDHPESDASDALFAEKRAFSRLTALASWRSEYILRTRLLRSLARGKPAQSQLPTKHGSLRYNSRQSVTAVVTYSSQFLYPVTHIHGTFGVGINKEALFIHGATEQGLATTSEPISGKILNWGASHQAFQHFADLFPGDAEWGLGPGNMVGVPNVMDVSQPHGMVYGEGCPRGRVYFMSSSEQRGRFLGTSDSKAEHQSGIPSVNQILASICSVWIAKSQKVLKMTNGIFGILSGSSSGIVTAYSLGPNSAYTRRFERGQVSAKWVLSPGVPIIAIEVDEDYSAKRHAQRRVWAVALNALGEIFYLDDIPTQPDNGNSLLNAEESEKIAWATGRSVRWELIESTRRVARPDPFNRQLVDGSYSPRSSSNSAGLSKEQIAAETKEIETFLSFKPKHFRKVCNGWDMRRKLQVDFTGVDYHQSGEAIVVINTGLTEGQPVFIRRFTRRKLRLDRSSDPSEPYPGIQISSQQPSMFSGSIPNSGASSIPSSPQGEPRSRSSSHCSDGSLSRVTIEWRISDFMFDDQKSCQITASAIDMSTFSQLTASEDPLLGMYGNSAASSPISSPLPSMDRPSTVSDIPGQRARFMAVGTATGAVYVFDMRAAASRNPELINSITPIRAIYTDSPQISSLALTSLYVVHGGNDGLVQAWDPLASSTQPIRTLNSRFSSRARRRLIQAEQSVSGVGENYYATGAICLDPDPTVLRGMVSLGTHLRYWSYSSSAADQYKSSKRHLRRSQRGSNSSPEDQRFSSTGRGALKEYIANEKLELERQKAARQKEREQLSSRFGVDLLGPGASEEEMLAYAQMLSEESYTSDEVKRRGSEDDTAASSSSETVAPNDSAFSVRTSSPQPSSNLDTVEEEMDPDVAEAIRLSMEPHSVGGVPAGMDTGSVRIKYAKGVHPSSPPRSPTAPESSKNQEVDDLEFALQLSLAEEQSRQQANESEQEDFPALSPSGGKGKGKARA